MPLPHYTFINKFIIRKKKIEKVLKVLEDKKDKE
jgi:hypothetical protein